VYARILLQNTREQARLLVLVKWGRLSSKWIRCASIRSAAALSSMALIAAAAVLVMRTREANVLSMRRLPLVQALQQHHGKPVLVPAFSSRMLRLSAITKCAKVIMGFTPNSMVSTPAGAWTATKTWGGHARVLVQRRRVLLQACTRQRLRRLPSRLSTTRCAYLNIPTPSMMACPSACAKRGSWKSRGRAACPQAAGVLLQRLLLQQARVLLLLTPIKSTICRASSILGPTRSLMGSTHVNVKMASRRAQMAAVWLMHQKVRL